jgi:hypothetical protein
VKWNLVIESISTIFPITGLESILQLRELCFFIPNPNNA